MVVDLGRDLDVNGDVDAGVFAAVTVLDGFVVVVVDVILFFRSS